MGEALSTVERRAGANIGRFGGEEFVLLLPGCDIRSAKIIADVACEKIRALEIPHRDSKANQFVTVSIGGKTLVPDRSKSSHSLFLDADRALYEAKGMGKNQAFVV
nr:diguanylate cyclase [Veronia nyctiphanis]